MTWSLLAVVVAMTVSSRVLPMALLPTLRGRFALILDALPAPLFASLAALALFGGDEAPTVPVLLATATGLVGATRRLLGLTLGGGLLGFAVGHAIPW